MKKLVVLLLAIVLLFSCVACGGEKPPKKNPFDGYQYTWAEDGVMKILGIGNSYTHDTFNYVPNVLEGLGITDYVVQFLYVGGTSLGQHLNFLETGSSIYELHRYENGKWVKEPGKKGIPVIESDEWDYISFNQLSAKSGDPDSYVELEELIAFVKPLVSETTKFVYNMTWAYAQKYRGEAFANYDNDQETMFWSIVSSGQNVVKPMEDVFLIAPVGTAIQNGRTSFMKDTFNSDGTHLNDKGKYLASLTYVSMLTGMSIENVKNAPSSIEANEQRKAMMIEAAMNAIENPFAITPSTYTE